MAVDKILIQYEADIKKMQKQLKGLEKKMGKTEEVGIKSAKGIEKGFLSSFGKIAAGIGIAFGAQALLRFVGDLNRTAAQMEAFERRASVVFGDSIGIVEDFAKKTAISLGLTESQFKGAAAAVGDILVPLGLSRKAAAEMSSEAVKLGGALKQFTGDQRSAGEIADVVAKAFTGEVEGLKGLGVVINQNDKEFKNLIKTKVENLGLTQSQAKAQAIFETVLDRSKDAVNAFDSDTGSLVRQQAELDAQITTITENFVKNATPAVLRITTAFNDFLRVIRSVEPDVGDFNKTWRNTAEITKLTRRELERLDFRIIQKEVDEAQLTLDDLNNQLEENQKITAGQTRTIRVQGKEIKLLVGSEEALKVAEESSVELRKQIITQQELLTKLENASTIARQRATDEELASARALAASAATIKGKKDEIKKLNKQLNESVTTNKEAKPILADIAKLEAEIFVILGKETDAQKKLRKEREKAAKEAEKQAAKELEDLIKLGEAKEKSFGDLLIFEQELEAERTEDIDVRVKAELEAERLKTNQQLQIAKDNEDEINLIIAKSEAERTKIVEKAEEDRDKVREEKVQKTIEDIKKIVAFAGEINNLLNTLGQRELEDFKEKNDKKLEALTEAQEAQEEQLTFQLDNREITEQEAENIRLEQEKAFAAQQENIKLQLERKEKAITIRQAKRNKALAIANIAIDTAAASVKALASPPAPNFIALALTIAAGVAQLIGVIATPIPGFKKGKVDIAGAGTSTSDSIPAMISKHESVINAKATKEYKGALEAANDHRLDDYINKNYVLPALKAKVGMDADSSLYDDYGLKNKVSGVTKQSRRNTDRIIRAIRDNDQQFQNYTSW